jgi:hypothetical protein
MMDAPEAEISATAKATFVPLRGCPAERYEWIAAGVWRNVSAFSGIDAVYVNVALG